MSPRRTPKRPSASTLDPNHKAPHSKLSPETAEQIVTLVRAGNYLDTAAAYAGVRKETLLLWLRKGRNATRGAYHEFAEQVDQALATAEVRDLALIGKAAETEWTAAAWRLERKFPGKYGRRMRHEGEIALQARPFLDFSKYTPEQLHALRDLLAIGQPDSDDPALGDNGRPALELLPGGETIDQQPA